MARAATRQTFVKGQTVYINAFSQIWHKAQVINPDFEQKKALAYGAKQRMVHYVKVIYFDRDSEKLQGAEWNVRNSRNKIIDQAAYDLILQGKEIARLHGDVRQHDTWEKTHAAYVDQAKIMLTTATMSTSLGLGKDVVTPTAEGVEGLALYLRSVFILKDRRVRERRGVADIIAERKELAHTATEARGRLQVLGVEPWS